MKAKTLLELLTLSTNVYMISKDEKFMNTLKEMTQKGREKFAAVAAGFSENEEEGKMMERFFHKAHEAKEELEQKIGEIVEKTYHKMNIAHTHEIQELNATIEVLTKELAQAEGRIGILESQKA